MNININGLRCNFIDQGEGETVLFLHGWGAPISLYQAIFDRLLSKGYRVAAFDMPGVGGTEEPPRPLTVQDYVDFTLEFCKKRGIDKAVIMCHSHGGRIALSMLGDKDCPVKCRKAVLIDSTGVPPKAGNNGGVRLRLYKMLKKLGTGRLTAPVFGGMYKRAWEKRASADYKAASPVMRQTMNNVLRCDLTPLMPGITASVLLIWGEHDTATTIESARVMEKLIPDCGLAVIKNAGHFSFADNWGQFSAVLDAFL